MNNAQPNRKRSTPVLVLAILAFAFSFLIYWGSETGLRFFLWRDQPLVAAALLVVSAVLFWFWWRGAGSKSA
jgi:high-affinity Fe2+/Pb2+ permease